MFVVKEREGLELLVPYHTEHTDAQVIVDANENPYTMPPDVLKKVSEQIVNLSFNRYPEIDAYSVKNSLALKMSLKAENIELGNGSSELLYYTCMAFGGNNRRIAYIDPSFSMYGVYSVLSGSESVPFALGDDFSLDAEKVKKFLQNEKPDVFIICNPNNPTGTLYSKEAIVEIVKAAKDTLVILDEAYMEFAEGSLLEYVKSFDNLVVMRTFSKAYGLAGVRAGYMVSGNEKIISAVSKMMLPYHMNAITLTIMNAVNDLKAMYKPVIDTLIVDREKLTNAFKELGFTVYPSHTNFIFLTLGAEKSAAFCKYLAENKISVRDFSAKANLKGGLRITVGTKEENDAIIKLAKEFISSNI